MTSTNKDIASTLGATLFGGDGRANVLTAEALTGKKFIGLYFTAAKYCPSCVAFTPTLKDSVTKMGLGNHAGGLQVITVSNDRTEADFKAYCGAMPWLSIPYDRAQEVKGELRDRYGIRTIPALVLLDAATGEVVTHSGRDNVVADPSGVSFPWAGAAGGAAVVSVGAGGEGGGGVKVAPSDHFVGGDGGGKGVQPGSWRHMTYTERVFTKPLLAMGHRGINPGRPDEMYMDENAVRVRAGIFNIMSMFVLVNLTFLKWRTVMLVVYPIVCTDFLFGSIFGLTPLAPVGTLVGRGAG